MTGLSRIQHAFTAVVALTLLPGLAGAQQAAIFDDRDRVHPVFAANGIVASQEETATRIGVEVLKEGGFSSVRRATETPFNIILEARA